MVGVFLHTNNSSNSSSSSINNNSNNNNNNLSHSLLVNTMSGPTSNSNASFITTSSLPPNDYMTSTDSTLPSSSDLQKIVSAYFEKKGYSAGDVRLLRDAKGNTMTIEQLTQYIKSKNSSENTTTSYSSPLLQHILNTNEGELLGDPDAYATSYDLLRDWIRDALDLYKDELSTVLYPIFIHIYLDLVSKELMEQASYFMKTYAADHVDNEHHANEIHQLGNIVNHRQVIESEVSQKYRINKYHITMSRIPYELFTSYIHDNKQSNLIRIVHQYISIQVIHENSAGGSNEQRNGILNNHNGSPVDNMKKEEDIMEIDGLGPFGDHTTKPVKQEPSMESPILADMSISPIQRVDIQAELDTLKDLRKRISQVSVALPSICAYTFHNTQDGLNCITISDEAKLIAGGFSESFVKVWSLTGDNLQQPNRESRQEENRNIENTKYVKLVGHSGPVYGASFNHDGEYLVSCSQDQSARLWNTRTFENLVVYKSHNYPVWDVDFGPFGFYFATASHDKTARLWACDHVYPLRIFAGHLSDVDVVKFHPNSKYLVTGSSDRTARLWDVQRGTCVRVFTGHSGTVRTVAISPNGRIMASAGEDRTINLWDLGSGRRLKTMTGHTDYIYSLDFSADSHVLVSGGADGTVRVWDVNQDSSSSPSTNPSSSSGSSSSTAATESSSATPTSIRGGDHTMKRIRMEESPRKEKSDSRHANGILESYNQLAVFPTKQTPIYTVQFTKRNLCLVAGTCNQ